MSSWLYLTSYSQLFSLSHDVFEGTNSWGSFPSSWTPKQSGFGRLSPSPSFHSPWFLGFWLSSESCPLDFTACFLGHMKAGRVALRPRKKQNICSLRDNLRGGLRGRILGGSRDSQAHQLGDSKQGWAEEKRAGSRSEHLCGHSRSSALHRIQKTREPQSCPGISPCTKGRCGTLTA